METIFKLNNLIHDDFLTGAREAEAYAKGEYGRISKSTQRKTNGFEAIATKARDNSLRTEHSWQTQYGCG